MRLLLSVEHPAWVHQFQYVIKELEKKGHEIKVVAIRKDVTFDLLNAYNIPFEIISDTSGKGIIEKGIIFLKTTYNIFIISRQFKPDLYIGRSSPMMAINSFFFNKPHILFEDTENANFSLTVCKLCSDVIITPTNFIKDLGKKQLRVNTHKELFYLHPNYYQPNPKILEEINNKNEKIIIIRFVAWDAHHDVGHHGISDKVNLVRSLEPYGRVLITSEVPLPLELERYQIRVLPEKFHDLLYYATLHIGDGGTIAAEAAILGTPSIYVSSFLGTMGNFIEFEKKYDLLYSFTDDKTALGKAVEILLLPDSKENWIIKRDRFLKDKIDGTAFMVWFIENYPQSFIDMKANPEIQYRFASDSGETS